MSNALLSSSRPADRSTVEAPTRAAPTEPSQPDPDCTRGARPPGDDRRAPTARPQLPSGAAPPTTRRIRPVPPGPSVTFVPLPNAEADDWDRRADALQWWMADLGGPHPVTVLTSWNESSTSRSLERTLRRFGVDVIEANASLIKGLLPAPPERAITRLLRWLARRPRIRLEIVEVRLEPADVGCRVSARAGGERAAEALRVALSELPPAQR